MGLMVETVENSENIKATGAGFNILNNWNRLTSRGCWWWYWDKTL